ncbi:preprotein translocase subunit SecA [Phycisphaerales bacterium AB-hyl4]|uniref:Protein translocase subunit SecA n=1 Tax=Natronomicrosphaera hydrolytica TaxID=3242702 RepID=A0ABV4TZY1_9BACT
MVIQTFSKTLTKIFGSRNQRLIKAYRRRVELINEQEASVSQLTDAELKAKTSAFRERREKGERVRDMLPEVMAVAREAMDRAVGIRNIFNPHAEFDASQLPADIRKTYDRIKAEADQLEPKPVLGGEGEAGALPGWMQVEIPNEIYSAVREIYPKSKPPFRARPFDVQLIGGMVLYEGKIAEMKTGEGKTIVGPLACYAAAIDGLQCHVITVNDYLVQRDRDWVFPFYQWLDLTVGAIHPYHMQPPQLKAQAYQCDVLYGTNSEFGFDYLRDNMKLSAAEQVQKRRDFCIVDEVDSILIDEARTPLIISGPAKNDAPRYKLADDIAKHLMVKQRDWDAANAKVEAAERKLKGMEGDIRNARDKARSNELREQMKQLEQELPQLEDQRDQFIQYYEVELDKKAAHLTHEGVAEAQKQAGIGSFYVGNNMDFPHLLENALRAHAVYKRDKDYVVRDGEVIIVDENTGRLMVGRQWSDGLHQAVESKENVKIKQETQTLATVTLQNFFKLYKRLAGMTGTAITEATEFNEIYKLDVVCIPTNVAVVRSDRNDLIFLSAKDKWNSILDEIKRVHDLGRPVLVGTTSVEKSEMLSQMLTKKHGVKHEVLNAKQHEREASIVEHAGELGMVMIATNMAGRGTDIKLRPIKREDLVRHWQQRNLLPAKATAEMSDDELIAQSYRHQAQHTLGLKKGDAEAMSDDDLKLKLLQHWCEQDAWIEHDKALRMDMEQCLATLDTLPDYQRHRLRIYTHTEEMGGLHIVGTERHESRRIDNQLRGRAGRQGDNGSSRFFISLEDDLMKMFAGKATLTALSKLGMKEGDAIEHKWVTKSVERAQRKVEERNYQIRKQLLDYDEVMEHQRNGFYGIRQDVLEGKHVSELIFEYIADSIDDAVETYLAADYVKSQAAEWCRSNLDVSIDPGKLPALEDLDEIAEAVRKSARSDVEQVVELSLGEYMSDDIPPDDWDLRGLQQWAMSRFNVDLKQNQVREMNPKQVQHLLVAAAIEQIEKKDLSGLSKYIDKLYGQKELASWARNKFGIELNPEELAEWDADEAGEKIFEQAKQAYQRREITYPVEFIMDLVFQGAQQDQNWAIGQLIGFAKQRFQLDWTPETVVGMNGKEIHAKLTEAAEQWLEGDKLDEQAKQKATQYGDDVDGLAAWMQERFGVKVDKDELAKESDRAAFIARRGREVLRQELTQLERFVLLQILDMVWKDHLYAMDQLKDSVGLRGYAQQDPRIEYKREGSRLYGQMQSNVRDRVTELIFRAKLTPNVQLKSAYGNQQQARHEEAGSTVQRTAAQQPVGAGAAAAAAGAGSADQQADRDAAEQAGGGDEARKRNMTRKQRRAAEARDRKTGPADAAKKRRKKSR